MARTLAALATALAIGAAIAASAQAGPPIGPKGPIVPPECRYENIKGNITGCTLCHIAILVINLSNFSIYWIALPATALLVAAGGMFLLTSAESEERRTLGKRILTDTMIGLAIVLLAWMTVDTTIKLLTGSISFGAPAGELIDAFGPWNKIEISETRKCPL